MSLEYLRQNPINDICEPTPAEKQLQEKRFSKGKFSILLGGNLVVWVIFIVSILDLNVFSMSSVSIPHLPQKLAVSGIVYHETRPTVIISKQVYCEGDVVDGYTIINISKTAVEFKKGDKTIIRQVR